MFEPPKALDEWRGQVLGEHPNPLLREAFSLLGRRPKLTVDARELHKYELGLHDQPGDIAG